MTQGVCFFTDYQSPVPLLVVALHSLRRFYSGPVHVICGSNTPAFFMRNLQQDKSVTISSTKINTDYHGNITRRCWNMKPLMHQQSPYDLTLLYDCDHVFYQPVDEGIFKLIEQYGLISCSHPWEKVNGRMQSRCIRRAEIIRSKIRLPCGHHIPVVNGGCVGSKKWTTLIPRWLGNIEKFSACGDRLITMVADEFALAHVLEQHGIPVADPKWSYSPWTEEDAEVEDLLAKRQLIAIHFAAGKYQKLRVYKAAVQAAMQDDYLALRTQVFEYQKCNSSFPV